MSDNYPTVTPEDSIYAGVVEALERGGFGWGGGDDYQCPNPAHDDTDPSCGISPGREYALAINCSSGENCDTLKAKYAMLDALGVNRAVLFMPPEPDVKIDTHNAAPTVGKRSAKGKKDMGKFIPPRIEYPYVDADGDILYYKMRMQYEFDYTIEFRGKSGLVHDRKKPSDVPHVLYRLPGVLKAASNGERILYVEGEKDVHSFEEKLQGDFPNYVCTTAGSSSSFKDEMADAFKGAERVYVIADRDGDGRKCASRVIAACKSRGIKVIGKIAPGSVGDGEDGTDLSDVLAAGKSLADLVRLDPPAGGLETAPGGDDGAAVVGGASSGNVVQSQDEKLEFSDASIAEKLAREVFAGHFCFCTELNGWQKWDGKCWTGSSQITAVEAVRDFVVDWYRNEVLNGCSDSRRAALNKLLSTSRISAVTNLSRGLVEQRATDFDSHHDMLNTQNGVVHLDRKENKLTPHDPALFMTHVTNVPYVPGATDPLWTQAKESLPPDVVEYYLFRLGQGITGHSTPDDKMVILQGAGENGKTTITVCVSNALADYATMISQRVITADPHSHPTELMELRGARLAYIEELPEARNLNIQRLKSINGTEKIEARYCGQDSTTFDVTHSLFVSSNYPPNVSETDHGTWRRLELIRFPYRYRKPYEEIEGPNDRRGNPHLREQIKRSKSAQTAALATLIDCAFSWYANDRLMPEPPREVVESTTTWHNESDLVLAYFDEHLVADPDSHVMASELLVSLNEWLQGHGHSKWSDKLAASRFGDHDGLPCRMEKKFIKKSNNLSSIFGNGTPIPNHYRAWLGVKFIHGS